MDQLIADFNLGNNPIIGTIKTNEHYEWSFRRRYFPDDPMKHFDYDNDVDSISEKVYDTKSLHEAVSKNQLTCLDRYNSDINAYFNGQTAICHARTPEMFNKLIEMGANPKLPFFGKNNIGYFSTNLDVFKCAEQYIDDINSLNRFEMSLMCYHMERRNLDIVEYLIPKVDYSTHTHYIIAFDENYTKSPVDLYKQMFDAGLELHDLAIETAFNENNKELMQLILDQNPDRSLFKYWLVGNYTNTKRNDKAGLIKMVLSHFDE